jgi:hypothetical protein
MTTCPNTSVPLSNDGIHYGTNNVATLYALSVTDLSHINNTSVHEPRQALAQSVGLAQHLLANPRLTATTIVIDLDLLRQQCNQEQTARQIAQNLVTQHEVQIPQL